MATIKLKPKQLVAIQQIQAQKQQVKAMFEDLNNKEQLVLELIFENAGIEGQISNVKLEEDVLSYDLEAVSKTPAKKTKRKVGKPDLAVAD